MFDLEKYCDSLKKKAHKLKKDSNGSLSHSQCLNQLSVERGFSSYKDLRLNILNKTLRDGVFK